MKYESKILELEEKFNKGEMFDYSNLREIDKIRRFALGNRTIPESCYLLEKSRNLLLQYIDKEFLKLRKRIRVKKLPTIEDDREKMRLFYLKMNIEDDAARSLVELEEEHQEIRTKIEEMTARIMRI